MKQFHVQTKNQVTGEWSLYARYKSRYLLGYVTKRWHSPLDCRECTRLVVVNQAEAELEAACTAILAANHVHRKRLVSDLPVVVCFIEAWVLEVVLDPNAGRREKLIWQNGEFGQKARTNGAHTV